MRREPVMVGTMYCGEGDFDRSCEMLKRQTWPHEHLVIENLSEVDAHLKLYKTFKESKFKYLLKLDADMVLNNRKTIATMVGKMKNYWRITHYVHDYFTAMKMNGVHMFSNDNIWYFDRFVEGAIKPDRYDALHVHRKKYRSKNKTYPEVMAEHCHYANERQCFHFGYHSLLKNEHKRLAKFVKHYSRRPNNPKLMLVASGIVAADAIFCYDSYDYNDKFDQVFESRSEYGCKAESMNDFLQKALLKVRKYNESKEQ